MLTVTNLEKQFTGSSGRVAVLNDVSFEIPAGAFFTLLGPSGCGKTTTLRCVAGLESPSGGSIEIGGKMVWSRPANGRVLEVPSNQRPIAMVFQSYAIWPHMTVFNNAAYPLRYGRKKIRDRKVVANKVEEILDRVGLGPHAQRMATDLSGGQQQRLALARALVDEPQLLLLDEPLSNLDAKLRVSLRAELKALQSQSGVTTLYVTHDQGEALAMSDLIAVMDGGQLVQIDSPYGLYTSPKSSLVAAFVAIIPTSE